VDVPGKAKGIEVMRKIDSYETFTVDQAALVMDIDAEKGLSRTEHRKLLKRAVDQLLVPNIISHISASHAGNDGDVYSDGAGIISEEEEGRL
jgi:hypothetical protein